jgi:hypothetical protein
MWSDRRAYLFLRAVTIKIQATGRMLVARWRYKLWKAKAIRKSDGPHNPANRGLYV